MDEQYPANSKVVKRNSADAPEAAPQKPKVQAVVTSPVRRKEKGMLRKAKEAFVGDDSKGVAEYVFVDILVPGVKRMFEDAVTQGLNRKLWGMGVPQNITPFNRPPQGWMNYQQPAIRVQPQMMQPQSQMSPQARANHRFDEIVFTARVDAESVLAQLYSLVGEYRIASVRDFYESAGEPFDFTDENFGWRDLSGAHVRPARGGGYSLALPRPESLN